MTLFGTSCRRNLLDLSAKESVHFQIKTKQIERFFRENKVGNHELLEK